MNDLLNFMPVYYVDVEKDQTVKMNKQLKKIKTLLNKQ